MFGIYYDNPKEMKDQNLCRSTIGLIVNPGEMSKVETFLNNYPSYRSTLLPSTRCLSVHFPFVNKLSFILLVSKVYPKLAKYIEEKKLENTPLIMEIYHFLSEYDKYVQVLAPLENADNFLIWEDDRDRYVQRKSR